MRFKSLNFLAIFLFLLTKSFSNENSYSIVFVYLGHIPQYIEHSISQARLFNPNASIYLIGNKNFLDNLHSKKIEDSHIEKIACESLRKSPEHQLFETAPHHRALFWKLSTERFIYISDFMTQYNLNNVFQIECDVMLYVNLAELLPVFQTYLGIASPFEHDNLASVSFTYFSNAKAAKSFAEFIPKYVSEADMTILALYKNFNPKQVDYLPIIFKEYADDQPLVSKNKHTTINPWKFYNHIEEFNSVFDSDLLGTYIVRDPGAIGDQVIYNPDLFKVIWLKDSQKRNIPYIKYKNVQYRVNTLHIHPKILEPFSSLNDKIPFPRN
jgi:hypothetical protein